MSEEEKKVEDQGEDKRDKVGEKGKEEEGTKEESQETEKEKAPLSGDTPGEVQKPLRAAVICAVLGSICVLSFLIHGFATWSVGLGVFLGTPLLVAAMVLYLIAVWRDLRRRDLL